MVIAPPTVYGGEELAALIAAQRVTHGFVTPAALASVDPTGLDTFLDVVVGGEACPPDLVSRWADPRRRFFNGYGPTETTIMTAISDPLVPGRTITIGGPTRGMSLAVLERPAAAHPRRCRRRAVRVGARRRPRLPRPTGTHRRTIRRLPVR